MPTERHGAPRVDPWYHLSALVGDITPKLSRESCDECMCDPPRPRPWSPAKADGAGRFLQRVIPVCTSLVLLLCGLLTPPAFAMTFDALEEYVVELETEYLEILDEFEVLQGRLENITREGATLKERKEYVDRILDLRRRLEALQKRRDELLKEAGGMPHAPPILKLVAIEAQGDGSDGQTQQGAGLTKRSLTEISVRNGAGDRGLVETLLSMRITGAPREIRPGEPFTISAEARMRKKYPNDHWCKWKREEERGDVSIAISSGEVNAHLRGERSLDSYCDEGSVQKHEWPLTMDRVWYTKGATIKGDSVHLTVRFKPLKKSISGSTQVFYYDADASGGRDLSLNVKTQYPFFVFDLPTDERGYLPPTVDPRDEFGSRASHGITVSVRTPLMGGILLRYEPVRETDPVLTSLSTPDHPSEFFEPLQEGAVRSVHTVPDVMDKPLEEALKELKKVGLQADYETGDSASEAGGVGKVYSQIPEAGDRVRRGKRVALKVYGGLTGLVSIPKVAREKATTARDLLESLGFEVTLGPGSPATSPDLNGCVEATVPPEGSRVDRDTKILLKVHSNYVDVREVPGVVGLSAVEAGDRLMAAGLRVRMLPGGKPLTREQSGTVARQDPDRGVSASQGSEVSLFVYGPFVETLAVPNVEGMSYLDAKRRLEGAGLFIETRDAGKPQNRGLAKTAQRQDPPYGTEVSKGKTVLVWFYGAYEKTREEWVAEKDCRRYPGSRAYWDEAAGYPKCACFNGLRWNLDNSACVTQHDFAIQWCRQNRPGSISSRKPDGGYECICPNGYVWADNPRRCVQQSATPDNNRDWRGWDRNQQCAHKLSQIKGFMDMYRMNSSNTLQKMMAENIAREAATLGCNQNRINQALGTGGGTGTGTGTGTGRGRGRGGNIGDICPCVDEDGRRYRVGFGQDCSMDLGQANKDYNCTE